MSIVIIDYPLPESAANRTEYEGKFLQLHWRGREYLVFAPLTRHRYHNQLLAHFLADHAIPHRWLKQETLQIDELELTVISRDHSLQGAVEVHSLLRFLPPTV